MYVKKALLLLFLLIAVACQQETPQEVRLQLNKMEFGRSIQSGKISKWLNSPTPAIRKMAVEAIGRVQDPETIPLLANHLSDPDPAVRGAIYFALGQFRDNEAELQRLLGKALDSESDPDNQARIIEAIGKVGTVDFLPQLAGYLRGENLALQEAAARAAGIMAYRGLPLYTFAPNVSGLMVNTTNTEVASEAAQAVYRIQVLDSFEELYLGLDRESPEVRYQVLRGLAHMADLIESDLFEERKKVSPTKEIWQTYSSREFRRKVFSQLQDSTWYVRVAAIHLLESMPAQTSQNELVEMLNDPQPAVRVEAIRSLAAEPYRNWLTLREMRKIVRNDKEDWRIQGEALTVLALVEPKEALKIVQDSWMQEAWPKSYYALEALSNIQPRKAGQQDPTSDEATRLIIDMADGKSLPRTIKALELLPTRPRVPEAAFFLRHLENGDPAVLNIVANYFAD
ncbi:MAG TPA: HEAT repeat domain-containing protein, partial [Calditrichia bacterium]|nr:HEAT repeat domain-containing protein [Calditrichia bacterium]